MKLNTMPKEVACELLAYIAEKEDFSAVCKSLGGEVSEEEISAMLREIAVELQKELRAELGDAYDVKKCNYLSKDAKKIISFLSPSEEKRLLKAFGLVEDTVK